MHFWIAALGCAIFLAPVSSAAQVIFQPPGCEFRAVFVREPKQQKAVVPMADGGQVTTYIGTLQGIVDGKPNIFRAECSVVKVPAKIDETVLLEDLKTTTAGDSLKNVKVWVEESDLTGLVGRARGELLDGAITYVMDLHRYFGIWSTFDAWVGSEKDAFPTRGNQIFLKELRLKGKPIN